MAFEKKNIEFKQKLTDGFEKEIVAFLNTEGGSLYIGLDKNGSPVGELDCDDIQLKVADRLKGNIVPSLFGLYDIEVEEISGTAVVRVDVSSGTEKPYYIKKRGMSESGCFIRVGSMSQPMSQNSIDAMLGRRVRTTLRNVKAPRQDLTFQQLKIYYAEHGKTLNDEFARNLELLTDDGVYNYLAYLLADENGVSIKVARYAGTDKRDLVSNEEYGHRCLITAAYRMLDHIEALNTTYAKITPKQRIERRLLDATALREAVINAVVHNDWAMEYPPVVEFFSDRATVTSYGGLPRGLTKEMFFDGCSMPRSRELMRVFRDVELVEQLGSGTGRILASYGRENFNIGESMVRITLPYSAEALALAASDITGKGEDVGNVGNVGNEDGLWKKICEMMEANPSISAKKISEDIKLSDRQIERAIKAMREKGIIERQGGTRGVWVVLGAKGE